MATWSPPNKTRIPFDTETFKKLVARFDSNHIGEAETAFRKAMSICVQAQLRFCDAAAETYGQSERAAELEAELAGVRELLNQREAQGAALADARDKLEQEFSSYRHRAEQELARLQQGAGRPIAVYCRRCEWKRAALALIAGWPLAKLWLSHKDVLPSFGFSNAEMGKRQICGAVLVATPLLAVLGRWWWLAFKRKHLWLSWRDNTVYRRTAAWWNAVLQRMTLT